MQAQAGSIAFRNDGLNSDDPGFASEKFTFCMIWGYAGAWHKEAMSFKRNLPSVNALVTLEAAMRLRSFTAAARELNVTQAAVSRQIRLLEDEFGIALFQRGHRRVEPTAAGEMLGTTMRQALEAVTETVELLRHAHEVQMLTVGATLAFSHFWLLPRLSNFREQHPELKIRIVSQDEPFDLRSGGIDVLMRFGVPPFPDGRVVVATHDRIFPVCSPAFAHSLRHPPALHDLPSLPLIGNDVPDASWMLWPDWFERVGVGRRSPRAALQFNHYTDGVAAALAGQGVALGWNLIVGGLIERGQLVRLGDEVEAEGTYNAVLPHKRAASAAADAFVDWIGRMFAASGPPAAS